MTKNEFWTKPWWERYPDRLALEIRELVKAELRFTIDPKVRRDGAISMTVDVPASVTGSRDISVQAIFPDLYPHFRPQIIAPKDLVLAHHLDPFGSDLCLVERGSKMWSPDDNLAWLLTVQLSKAIASADARDPNQAEPFSAYLTYAPNSAILIETDHLPPTEILQGTIKVSTPQHFPAGDHHWLAATKDFRWPGGNVEASPAADLFSANIVDASWVRLDGIPNTDDPQKLFTQARKMLQQDPAGFEIGNGHYCQLIAVLFPEEQADGATGSGVFFIISDTDTRPRTQRRKTKQRGKLRNADVRLIRTSRMGASDLISRAPELAAVAKNHVMIVGCGALGSTLADAIARAGVEELTLIDEDILDAGNLLRHASTIHFVGLPKAVAVAHRAEAAHPGLVTHPLQRRIGSARIGSGDTENMQGIFPSGEIRGVDLVIDATAEIAVHEVLSAMCRDLGKMYICVEATPGAWGGVVSTYPSTAAGCWNCLEHHLQDGTLSMPASDTGVRVQPPGCADPTFTGTQFDLGEVALHGARVAMIELMTGLSATSARLDSVDLRNAPGERILPRWTTAEIAQHPLCRWHS